MTYGEAVKYILDIPKFSKKNSAEHTGFLLNSLGNPQDAVKVIHVATGRDRYAHIWMQCSAQRECVQGFSLRLIW